MILAFTTLSFAQNAETPAKRTTTPPAKTETTQTGTKAKNPASMSMLDTFNALLEGIRSADVKIVTGIYWKSAQLIVFNNNGTVTRGWDQVRKNRESSYPDMKDVVLEVRDVKATMLGPDAGVINCLWTQSQTFRGVPETASGRMTIVFRRIGTAWKAIHVHTSPEAPDPSRVLQSEQMPASAPTEAPKLKATP
jgi:ketosteroid isomerase-like protein